jgi:hypothetical protein
VIESREVLQQRFEQLQSQVESKSELNKPIFGVATVLSLTIMSFGKGVRTVYMTV